MPVGTNLVPVALLLLLQHQELLAQDFLSVVTDKKYECASTVELRCAPSGCCGGSILWRKDGIQIMAGGLTSFSGKYRQTTVAGSHFDFAIADLNQTDLGASFTCVFSGSPSNGVTLNAEDYYCPPCWDCGGKCFGYSLIGVIMAVAIGAVIYKKTDKLQEKFVMITVISGVTGLVLDVFVALFTGANTCLCDRSHEAVCIVIGLGVGLLVVLVVFLIFYFVLKKGKFPKGNQKEGINSKDTNH